MGTYVGFLEKALLGIRFLFPLKIFCIYKRGNFTVRIGEGWVVVIFYDDHQISNKIFTL